MNVTGIVAAVASLGTEYEHVVERRNMWEALARAVCEKGLLEHINRVGVQAFLEQPDRLKFQKAELVKPKEKKELDANSLPKSGE